MISLDRLANRVSGLACAAFGAALLFWIIPTATEEVSYGWVRPQTVPTAMAWVILIGGLGIALRPEDGIAPDGPAFARAALLFALVALGCVAIDWTGFVVVAPVLALAVMLWMGMRSWLWLAIGAFGVPFVTWLAAEVLLGRPLP